MRRADPGAAPILYISRMAKGARFIGDDDEHDDATDRDAPSAADMARFGGDDDESFESDHDDEAFDEIEGRWEGVGMPAWKKGLIAGGVLLAFAAALALSL